MLLSPLKCIRGKCLDCCCGSAHEVKLCTLENCPLHPYRFGKYPGNHREATPAQLEALRKGRLTSKALDKTSVSAANSAPEYKDIPKDVSGGTATV